MAYNDPGRELGGHLFARSKQRFQQPPGGQERGVRDSSRAPSPPLGRRPDDSGNMPVRGDGRKYARPAAAFARGRSQGRGQAAVSVRFGTPCGGRLPNSRVTSSGSASFSLVAASRSVRWCPAVRRVATAEPRDAGADFITRGKVRAAADDVPAYPLPAPTMASAVIAGYPCVLSGDPCQSPAGFGKSWRSRNVRTASSCVASSGTLAVVVSNWTVRPG